MAPKPTFVIKGERNSGTNYLRNLLLHYFSSNYRNIHGTNWDADGYYGWKHGFIFDQELTDINKDQCIVIVITKSIYSWLYSMFRKPYELKFSKTTFSDFINPNHYVHDIYENWIQQFYQKKGVYYGYRSMYALRQSKLQSAQNPKIQHLETVKYEDLLQDHTIFIKHIASRYHLLMNPTKYINHYPKRDYYLSQEYLKHYTEDMLQTVRENMDPTDY